MTLAMRLGVFLVGLALLSELGLRLTNRIQPSYYARQSAAGTVFHYPYGDIAFNRDGFPDEEFREKKLPRIGYFGDSIVFGVGAGSGYRLSDRLRRLLPSVEHLTFAGLGDGLTNAGISTVVRLARRYGIDQVVYVLNLDDILPSSPPPQGERRLVRALGWIRAHGDRLRGHSYLYSYLRSQAVAYFTALGFGTGGNFSYELFPSHYPHAIVDTAARVRNAQARLRQSGITLLVVILPYEMQVSEEAARVYAAHGIQWESGFQEGSTQRALLDELSGVETLDALSAFVERPNDRSRNRLGQYFVYNRGEKLDWNHPNRLGHARLAEWLAHSGALLGSSPGS